MCPIKDTISPQWSSRCCTGSQIFQVTHTHTHTYCILSGVLSTVCLLFLQSCEIIPAGFRHHTLILHTLLDSFRCFYALQLNKQRLLLLMGVWFMYWGSYPQTARSEGCQNSPFEQPESKECCYRSSLHSHLHHVQAVPEHKNMNPKTCTIKPAIVQKLIVHLSSVPYRNIVMHLQY